MHVCVRVPNDVDGYGQADADALRWPLLQALRAPDSAQRASMTQVDFSDAGLEQIDVRAFVAVRQLSLRGNRLASLSRVVGLPDLRKLQTLNVQYNALSSLEEIARLLSLMPLHAVGIAGNPLIDAVKQYRSKLVAMLPALVDGVCALRTIDDVRITPADVCAAHIKKEKDADAKRYTVALTRQVPPGVQLADVVELDLSYSALKLKGVDMSPLRSVRRLSLAHNQVQSKNLALSNLARLSLIEEVSE
jgi:Leucine-rich repeat (LRR) protein